jgi:hypothetical protein
MVQFDKDELKLILGALETIQEARQSISASAVIEGDYTKADAAWRDVAEREIIIKRIKEYLEN